MPSLASSSASQSPNNQSGSTKSKRFLVLTFFVVLALLIAYLLYNFTSLSHPIHSSDGNKSIAVIPLKNISQDHSDDYFSEGLTGEIINHLSKVRKLKVMSHTSVNTYKDRNKNIPTIASELDVSYILDGGVRRSGSTIQVSVQLIQAASGTQLWSKEYNKPLTEILKIQDDISLEVANALTILLSEPEKKMLGSGSAVNPAAYDFYLKARTELMNYRFTGISKGRSHLTQAIGILKNSLAIDPGFAKAHSALGLAYYYKGDYRVDGNEHLLDSTKLLADNALAIDISLDEGYYLRGLYYFKVGNYTNAIAEFEKALESNPNDAEAMMHLGSLNNNAKEDYVSGLSQMQQAIRLDRGPELASNLRLIASTYQWLGLFEKSRELDSAAFRLDGDSSAIYELQSTIARSSGRLQECLSAIGKASQLDSANWLYADEKAWVLGSLGNYKEALKIRLKWSGVHRMDGGTSAHRIGYLYWMLGDKRTGLDYLRQMIEDAELSIKLNLPVAQWKFSQYDLAGVFAFLGEKEKAYAYLDEVNQRKFIPIWLLETMREDPLFESIKHEERFNRIYNEMGKKYERERDRVIQWLKQEMTKGIVIALLRRPTDIISDGRLCAIEA